MSTETTLSVVGMTCGHCVSAVSGELSAIDGVRDVQVDLDSGRVQVISDGPLEHESILEAIDEAGFELAP